jgi:transposase InsO family protein
VRKIRYSFQSGGSKLLRSFSEPTSPWRRSRSPCLSWVRSAPLAVTSAVSAAAISAASTKLRASRLTDDKPGQGSGGPLHSVYRSTIDHTARQALTVQAALFAMADITYIPIGQGFLYLVAIMDWASRAVLAWRLSNTMDGAFCVAALEEALQRYGRPDIFNPYPYLTATRIRCLDLAVGPGVGRT